MDISKIQIKLNNLQVERETLTAKIDILNNYLTQVREVPEEIIKIVNGEDIEIKQSRNQQGKNLYSWELVDYIKENQPCSREDLMRKFAHTSIASHLSVIKKEGFCAERKGIFTFIKNYPEGYNDINRNKGGYTISEKIQFIFVDRDDWLRPEQVKEEIKKNFNGSNEKLQSIIRCLNRSYKSNNLQRENGFYARLGVPKK